MSAWPSLVFSKIIAPPFGNGSFIVGAITRGRPFRFAFSSFPFALHANGVFIKIRATTLACSYVNRETGVGGCGSFYKNGK